MTTKDELPCANCGTVKPLYLLDAKPTRLAGAKNTDGVALLQAFEDNEDFDRLECQSCYGPGWIQAHGPRRAA